jgi:hypothetical protein
LSESAELIHLGSIVSGQIATRFALVPAVLFWEHYFIRRCVQQCTLGRISSPAQLWF